ncbi:scaffolding protein [Symbiopectobacterium sp. Eva_TO]
MEQQAENQSPEVEIEEQSPEQIPDDAGQQPEEDVEQAQSTEPQTDDDGDDEEEFYFGDEKLESPTSEEKDPALVRHLRNTIKEKERELKALRTKSPQQQQAPTQAPRMPQLSDDGIDYDEAVFQQKLSAWSEENAKYHTALAQQQQAQQVAQQQYQQRLQQYQERVKTVKVPNYQQAEKLVIDEVPEAIQAAVIQYAEKPEMVVIALARNPELRKQFADATDPVELGRQIGIIESKAKTMPKAKPTAGTVPAVKGSNGAELNSLEKLKEEARKSCDWSAYFAAKRAKK